MLTDTLWLSILFSRLLFCFVFLWDSEEHGIPWQERFGYLPTSTSKYVDLKNPVMLPPPE